MCFLHQNVLILYTYLRLPEPQQHEKIYFLPQTVTNSVKRPVVFTPRIPVQTRDDLYYNIVLVDRNYNRTRNEFNRLECGTLELTSAPLDNQPNMFKASIKVSEFTLIETEAAGRRRAEVIAKRHFMDNMGKWCYRIVVRIVFNLPCFLRIEYSFKFILARKEIITDSQSKHWRTKSERI